MTTFEIADPVVFKIHGNEAEAQAFREVLKVAIIALNEKVDTEETLEQSAIASRVLKEMGE